MTAAPDRPALPPPAYEDDSVVLFHGDCIDVLRALPDNHVDAVITDPPYGLNFMGRGWDRFDEASLRAAAGGPMLGSIAQNYHGKGAHTRGYAESDNAAFGSWVTIWAVECLRVLKPGGHLLAFGGSRTWHRLATGIEDAGFELRDSIAWLYGSGFPKSLDVSKAIDKAAGAQRPVVGERKLTGTARIVGGQGSATAGRSEEAYDGAELRETLQLTGPATDLAKQWDGWGTALKPAFEPIVVGRKPLIGTVVENVTAHGTGALNIAATRVGSDGGTAGAAPGGSSVNALGNGLNGAAGEPVPGLGRWPTNVLLDESQAAELDRQVPSAGAAAPASGPTRSGASTSSSRGAFAGTDSAAPFQGDSGGASRFFPTFRYEAKAPTFERPKVGPGKGTATAANRCALCGKQDLSGDRCQCPQPEWEPRDAGDGTVTHPTVKPLDLMRWLVRLVTPPGGLVLEPFAGSGTTAEACVVEGARCIAIEREEQYLGLIRARLTKPIALDLFGGME